MPRASCGVDEKLATDPELLHVSRKRVEASKQAESGHPIVEASDETIDVAGSINEADLFAESNLTDDVISHEHAPVAEIKWLSSVGKLFSHGVRPVPHACVNHWLHLFNVGETVRAGNFLAHPCVLVMFFHIEDRFHLST